MLETIDVWFLDCSTGCSCCASENFIAGPFLSEQEATDRAASYRASARLASQYSSRGNYRLSGPHKGERLPDGRIIVSDQVYAETGEERPDR